MADVDIDIPEYKRVNDNTFAVIIANERYQPGHGVPNEKTRDAFLLPVDADGSHTEVCYPLGKLYQELASLHVNSVIVFLDACFCGVSSDGTPLSASARGLGLMPKQVEPTGNMVVFSAASGDETAYPYADHGHGLFTYFLLKKLQDSKGSASLGDLASFIIDNVKKKSVLINQKIQTPTVRYPLDLQTSWQKMKLR